MTLTLNTWQRIILVRIVEGMRGTVGQLRQGMRLLDALELSDEEKAQVGYQENGNAAYWDDTERRWSVTIERDEDAQLLRRLVEQFDGWPQDNAELVFDLVEQLAE